MVGTRANWKTFLPLIQAFVNGEKIQKRKYDGSWEDTEELFGFLGDYVFRIKPKNAVKGIWTIDYKIKKSLIEGTGTMKMISYSDSPPIWPLDSSITYIKESQKFTPFES